MNNKRLSKTELEDLIKGNDQSVKPVQKMKTAKSSEYWDFFQVIFVHNVRQQFISCNSCKRLVMYSVLILNDTNSLRSHVNICPHDDKAKTVPQKTVDGYYSALKQLKLSKSTKTKILEVRTEFCTVDGCAFNIIHGEGFTNLVQVLVEVGQSTNKSKFKVADSLLHPTTVSANKRYINEF